MFLHLSVILLTGGAGCAWLLGPGGHAWLLGGCVWLLQEGACMVVLGGHAWLLQGGHAWLLWGACMVAPGGHVWLLWGVYVVASRGHAWDTTRYADMVNERAVRILLECILVNYEIYFFHNNLYSTWFNFLSMEIFILREIQVFLPIELFTSLMFLLLV